MSSLLFLLFKLAIIALLILHVLFSLVVIRQTRLMIKVVEAQISGSIYAISFIHLGISLFVLLFAILFI